LDIERINTTPRHPECDGQTEKNIQHLKKMMRAYVNEKQSNWDQGLSQLAYAYNTSVHETIGLTPFEVMFGRKTRIPIDSFYPNTNEMNRPVIQESKTFQLADVQNKLSTSSVSNDQSIDVLPDISDALYHAYIRRFSLKSCRVDPRSRDMDPRSWDMDPRSCEIEPPKVDFLNCSFNIYSFYSFTSLIPRGHPPILTEIMWLGPTFVGYGPTFVGHGPTQSPFLDSSFNIYSFYSFTSLIPRGHPQILTEIMSR
jgi:hypothetical protein